jgi:hypothetical protein
VGDESAVEERAGEQVGDHVEVEIGGQLAALLSAGEHHEHRVAPPLGQVGVQRGQRRLALGGVGAMASHLAVHDSLDNLVAPATFAVLALLSWALRPASRRL